MRNTLLGIWLVLVVCLLAAAVVHIAWWAPFAILAFPLFIYLLSLSGWARR